MLHHLYRRRPAHQLTTAHHHLAPGWSRTDLRCCSRGREDRVSASLPRLTLSPAVITLQCELVRGRSPCSTHSPGAELSARQLLAANFCHSSSSQLVACRACRSAIPFSDVLCVQKVMCLCSAV
ncbi:hypothetical protein E2C01_038371 [Portunus trituberculatus]|uniref:Uncharacterized protein n=1 Tax=Portunus trituberculatus TaxID=210409 RepID=A0A5B7FE02_PORTR|nr:hypothetical protein [Portunus trituberculatus]